MWNRIRQRFGRRRPDEKVTDAEWRARTSKRELELDRDRPEFRDDFGEKYGEEPKEPDSGRF